MSLGNILKGLRKAKDLTQQDVAKAIGYGASRYSNYENEIRMPNLDEIKALADFYEVSVDYLLNRTNTEEPSHLGDHKKNLDYFGDKPDLLAVYNDIVESDNLRLLFDSAKDLEPKDLETVLKIVKSLKESDD